MRTLRIGRAFGVPIKLDWTFLVVLPVFAVFIGMDVDRLVTILNDTFGSGLTAAPLTAGFLPWVLGLVSALGLFGCVLLHEFGHSLVAARYGYEVESITLWLLGGRAEFAALPEDWRHELTIAIAGPVVSVLLGAACYGLFVAVPAGLDPVRFVVGYLAVLNVVLAAFNLLPAFPMDGGRILRALLTRSQSHARATQQAATVGKLFAFLLGVLGVFVNWFLVLLALFIYVAASSEAQQTALKAAFEGTTVRDVMTHREDLDVVAPDVSVADLLDRMFADRHVGYPVVGDGALVGIVTLDDASSVPEVERDAYRVEDVMTTDVTTTTPSTGAMEAFETLQGADVGRLPVVDDEDLVGLVSRTDLMRAFEIIQSGG